VMLRSLLLYDLAHSRNPYDPGHFLRDPAVD